ncbi:MAG: ATP-binding protein [Myxococcales bacterium]|nr:ATP-binding protein [Myxococcales bacterium]
MSYERIEAAVDLPAQGPFSHRARERVDLDFKTYADPKKLGEHAKDVALFANGLGGVLLIGASDHAGRLDYPGLKGQTATDVVRIYEQAAKDHCSPNPVVDIIPIQVSPELVVVAVNVDPFLDGLVGAKRERDTWIFPIRIASQTRLLMPEELPMYMNQQARRSTVLLSRILTRNERGVDVHYRKRREINSQHWDGVVEVAERRLWLEAIAPEKNAVVFVERGAPGTPRLCIPLLDILDAWEAADDRWQLKVTGEITQVKVSDGYLLRYRPLPWF